MPSIKGVTLERIDQEYHRPKAIPTTLSQVADMVGLDYLEMMDFIRREAPDFEFHVITQQTLERLDIPREKRAEYLLDYYLGAESSMVSLAIIFDYSTDKAVRRTLHGSEVYKNRVKPMRDGKRNPRERMIEVVAKIPAAIVPTKLTVYELNKVILKFCDAKLPVFTEWAKVETRHYDLYPPIYKKAMNLALERSVNLDDLISSAILKVHLTNTK